MMIGKYDNWKIRLEVYHKYATVAERRAAIAPLKINFAQPNENDCGYYRRPIAFTKNGGGKTIVTDWAPVAFFVTNDRLYGLEGRHEHVMTPDEINDEGQWSWLVSNPISYELYKAVVEQNAPWPDMVQQLGHNRPPEDMDADQHRDAIDAAIGAAKDLKVTTTEEANIAQGAINRLAELRLAADKAGKALYDPPFREYKKLFGIWAPMVATAKVVEDRLDKLIKQYREQERRRLAAEAAEAERKQREAEEANERAAQRAIAAGEPEQAPEIDDADYDDNGNLRAGADHNAAPPPIKPTYGKRAPKDKVGVHLDAITDFDAVYRFFAADQQVKDLLTKLAKAAIKNGHAVPGTTTHEGIV